MGRRKEFAAHGLTAGTILLFLGVCNDVERLGKTHHIPASPHASEAKCPGACAQIGCRDVLVPVHPTRDNTRNSGLCAGNRKTFAA